MNSASLQVESPPRQTGNAWGATPPAPTVCSLTDVMSEELALLLEKEENCKISKKSKNSEKKSPFEENDEVDGDTSNDLLLAQMLQHEFDRAADEQLRLEEEQYNGNSKVSLSFSHYRCVHPAIAGDEDDEDLSDGHSDNEERFVAPTFNRSGVAGRGKSMISKHDAALNAKRNAHRLMEFPCEFESGDSRQLPLPNRVFNVLKVHMMNESKRAQRLHDKQEKATAEQSLDSKTRLLLYKLINADILQNVAGCISTGKEATVFYATGGKSTEVLVPAECVAKVFKTTLNEFKNRDKYIRDDYRFRDRLTHQNPRKVIHLWAEKEMHNLMKMRYFGIPCPDVVLLKKHILVMSFIGTDQRPAPKLKEAALSAEQMQDAYEQVVEIMKKLFRDCQLVHADLSEYNILWHQERAWIIDVSQSVEPVHPLGLEFLLRDCRNVVRFFSKNNVPDVPSAESLFNSLTELNFTGEGRDFLSQLQEYEKSETLMAHAAHNQKEFVFDYFFERSLREREDDDDEEDDEDEEDEDEREEEEGGEECAGDAEEA